MLLLFALIVGSSQLWADETTDVINNSATSSSLSGTGTSSWADDFTLTGSSGAEYYIHSMGIGAAGTHALQWNKNGYLYATKSGGTLKSITIVGTDSKSVDIYASSTAYSAKPTTNKITSLSISSAGATYTFEEDYEFIAINGVASSTQITSISIVWGDGSSSSTPVDATWSVNPEDISVKVSKKATAEITTNYNGTLSVTSNNNAIATATYANGIITVEGVAEGTTKLTITGDATSKYNAIDKTIDVAVTANIVTPGTYSITPNNAFYGTDNTYSGNSASNPNNLTGEQDDITITYSKGSQANFYVSTTQTRCYDGSTMTFEVPNAFVITDISFTADGSNWTGTHTADEGKMIDNKNWEGVAQEVTITFGGTCRIAKIEVTYCPSSISKEVGSTGWATWIAPYNIEVPTSVTAYIVTASTTQKATLAELLAIPVGTPVLLQGEGTHNFTVCSEDDLAVNENDPADNLLEVSDEETTSGVYVLANDEEGVGFYKWAGGLLGAGYVYLPAPAGGARSFLSFDFSEDNGTTGIGAVLMNSERVNNEVYNLSGQRVAQPTKGLYIVNGKKVVIK